MGGEIAEDFSPYLRVYKDGRVDRLVGTATVPPSLDETTGVLSKDILISSVPTVSARLYIPKCAVAAAGGGSRPCKLPILIYFHGGIFCLETAASPTYHNYLNTLVAESDVIAVSVDYRRPPEDPLPAAYSDSWAAVTWLASHSSGQGPEEWLNLYGDLNRVFFAGDSAGANIAHHMGLKFGEENELHSCVKLLGLILVHPFFMGRSDLTTDPEKKQILELLVRFWRLARPETSGCDDPMINPAMDPRLSRMGCKRILIFVAQREALRPWGLSYKEQLIRCGWKGAAEVMEADGEDHLFHLLNPGCDRAIAMMQRLVSFLNQD